MVGLVLALMMVWTPPSGADEPDPQDRGRGQGHAHRRTVAQIDPGTLAATEVRREGEQAGIGGSTAQPETEGRVAEYGIALKDRPHHRRAVLAGRSRARVAVRHFRQRVETDPREGVPRRVHGQRTAVVRADRAGAGRAESGCASGSGSGPAGRRSDPRTPPPGGAGSVDGRCGRPPRRSLRGTAYSRRGAGRTACRPGGPGR